MSSNKSVNVRSDPTANLPDEVLCSIISHIPSLPHRFKLAAVNNKLRRCVMEELNKPIPLDINFYDECLNGHRIPIERWPKAMQVLAPKTDFTEIAIYGFSDRFDPDGFDQLLSILSVSDCLGPLRSFNVRWSWPLRFGPIRSILPALTQCAQLSILRLGFPLCAKTSEHFMSRSDLRSVVANKPLTELRLELDTYSQEDLIKLFESLKPKVLKILHLKFTNMSPLIAVDLLNNNRAVWSGLTEIQLDYDEEMIFAPTVSALTELSMVQRCTINTTKQILIHELSAGAKVLFNKSNRQQPLVLHVKFNRHWPMDGSLLVDLIGQLKQAHPDIQVDFYLDIIQDKVRLELDNVSFVSPVSQRLCYDPDCLEKCHLVYPIVVCELTQQANGKRSSTHLENFRLDRCRVDRVVTDFNSKCNDQIIKYGVQSCVQAMFATKAGDLVVIAFEDEDGDQFYITIDTTHCLSGGCIGCLEI